MKFTSRILLAAMLGLPHLAYGMNGLIKPTIEQKENPYSLYKIPGHSPLILRKDGHIQYVSNLPYDPKNHLKTNWSLVKNSDGTDKKIIQNTKAHVHNRYLDLRKVLKNLPTFPFCKKRLSALYQKHFLKRFKGLKVWTADPEQSINVFLHLRPLGSIQYLSFHPMDNFFSQFKIYEPKTQKEIWKSLSKVKAWGPKNISFDSLLKLEGALSSWHLKMPDLMISYQETEQVKMPDLMIPDQETETDSLGLPIFLSKIISVNWRRRTRTVLDYLVHAASNLRKLSIQQDPESQFSYFSGFLQNLKNLEFLEIKWDWRGTRWDGPKWIGFQEEGKSQWCNHVSKASDTLQVINHPYRDFQEKKLSGKIPNIIGDLSFLKTLENLKSLTLSIKQVNPFLVQSLKELKKLEKLDLIAYCKDSFWEKF